MNTGKIRNRIRRWRFINSEMTQQELAERTGVSRQTIISLESGRYIPSLDLAFRIALTFNKNIEDVFEYRAPQEPDPEWDSFSDYSD